MPSFAPPDKPSLTGLLEARTHLYSHFRIQHRQGTVDLGAFQAFKTCLWPRLPGCALPLRGLEAVCHSVYYLEYITGAGWLQVDLVLPILR